MPTRPLSPHIQVYRTQMTSLLSLSHRITGVWLGIGAVFLVWWLVSLAVGPGPFAAADEFFGSWLGRAFLLGWNFAVCFHLANGIRHLFWDVDLGFSLKATYASGWTVIVFSLLLTAATWGAAWAVISG